MTKERIVLYKRIVLFLFWSLIIALLFPIGTYAKLKRANDRIVNATQIQFMLSQKGYDRVAVDGICGQETYGALKEYKDKLDDAQKKYFSISCSDQTLNTLRNDVRLNQSSQQSSDNQNATEINNINKRLLSTNDSIHKLSATISKQYDEQFRNLAQIGIAAYITSISIIIAGIAFLGNMMIKDQVMEAHNKVLKKSRRELKYMIKTAHPQLSSSIHASLSASFTKLYAEIDPREKRHLYNPYVTAAVDMAAMGYRKAQEMHKLIMDSESKKDRNLSEDQAIVIDGALNNYAYFLSDMTTLKNKDGSRTEEAKHAKEEIGRLLPSLESARDRIVELKKQRRIVKSI